jgi:ATP-dependent exoDNAse (exonuclease V) beta subunit
VAASPLRPPALSYSALTAFRRCGYRYYVERELRLPPRPADPAGVAGASAPSEQSRPPAGRLSGAERGTLTHALLEALDPRHPRAPSAAAVRHAAIARGLPALEEADVATVTALVARFAETDLAARLGRATQLRREQPFAFSLAPSERRVTGVLDVLARERTGMLVIDYKTDRLLDRTAAAAAADYADQRLIYALAVLLSGAARVEIAHVFLEQPEQPVTSLHTAEELEALRARLAELTDGIERRAFAVTVEPHRALCDGCPAEGGLCSWPLAMTRRLRPDQLF